MVAIVLFWSGTVVAVMTGIVSWINKGDDKRGVALFPFALLAAAAVAKYIGI